jgi:hypothetical protein
MDSGGPVGYFRIEMRDSLPPYFSIKWMFVSPDSLDLRSMSVGGSRIRVL